MEVIKKMVLTFVLTLAGITISTALFITLFFSKMEISVLLIWQIVIMSAVCALGNLIFYSKREVSKRQMKIRNMMHYLYINVIVIGGAILWKWITPGFLLQLFVMLILIAIVYSGVTYMNIKKEEKTAEVLNERLKKLHSDEDKK